MTTCSGRRRTAALVAAGVALTALACTPGQASEAAVAAPSWQPCRDAPALQCATLTVPLDHDDPGAGTVDLAMARLPATGRPVGDPVVLHRGGPGYGSVDYLTALASGQLPAPVDDTVRRDHDLVAVDQRGTGRSGPPLPCRDTGTPGTPRTAPGLRAGLAPFPDVPTTEAGLTDQVRREADIRARCRSTPGFAHLGTVDAARDLDLVRTALGSRTLTMIGQSYGAYLGTVYADLFPDRVGRLVLDSVVGPSRGREGGTAAGRAGSDVGTEQAMDDFLNRCSAAGPACAFGGGDAKRTFDALVERLRADPLRLRAADGSPVTLTAPHVLEIAGMLVYQPSTWATMLAPYLAAVSDAVRNPGAPIATEVATGVQATDRRPDDPLQAGFEAVTCGEVPTPEDAEAWATAVRERAPMAPRFAALRAAETMACVGAPRDAEPLPALDRPIDTDGQVLLVNNRIDPATPLSGAEAARALFEHAALVVNEGTGHVAAQQSRCTVGIASTFLDGGPLPAPGTRCTPDRDPFAR